jgi:hypothetical protein
MPTEAAVGRDDRDLAVLGVGAALAALVTAWRCWTGYFIDDAWISFRYAARLAAGAGLTFDDHEKVLGTSAPLWTLLVAAGDRLGLDAPDAARVVGCAAYVAVVVVSAVLAHRLLEGDRRGLLAAGAAAALLVLPSGFRNLALSGMESGLAAALGVAAILAFASRRPVLAGVLAGLAVVNKLDALLLVAALLAIALLVERRPAWRTAVTAGLVVAPWVLFATIYYGSPVPQSFRRKLEERPDVSPDWAVRALADRHLLLLAVVGVIWVVWRWRTWPPASQLIGGTLAAWFVGHLLAISLVDLGYEWAWYLTVLEPPIAILGAAAVVDLVLLARDRRQRLVEVALLVAAVGFALGLVEQAGDTVVGLAGGDLGGGSVRIEQDLLDAGALIEAHSGDGDVVESCLGTIQYATLSQPQIDVCGLSTVDEPGPATWYVQAFYDFGQRDRPPEPGFRAVADFTSSCSHGMDPLWLRVYVRAGTTADAEAPDDAGPVDPRCAR